MKRCDKRGISAIVATVLIILITIAAVTIIWGLVLPMLEQGEGFGTYNADVVIETDGGYTYFDSTKGVACVQVKRLSSDLNLTRIDVLFSFDGTTIEYKGNFSGDKLPVGTELKQKCFNLTFVTVKVDGKWVAPDSITVVPIYFDGINEVVGDVTATVTSSTGNSGSGNLGGGNFPDGGSAEKVGGCKGDGECDDGNECTTDSCSAGVCLNVNVDSGTDCSGGFCSADSCIPENLIFSCPRTLDKGIEYTLINNISTSGTCFTVAANGVTIDFNGHSITGNYGGDGVSVNGYGGIIIKDGFIYGFSRGIYLSNSHDSDIIGMVVNDVSEGIYFKSSSNNQIIDSVVSLNYNYGIWFELSSYNSIIGSIVDLNQGSGIHLELSSNNDIIGNIVNKNEGEGIYLELSSNNDIIGNIVNENEGGIDIFGGSNNNFTGNTISLNKDGGINIMSSLDNWFMDNIVCSEEGQNDIACHSSSGNSGTGNTFGNGMVIVCSDNWPDYGTNDGDGDYGYCS